jgi:hypothetical protein
LRFYARLGVCDIVCSPWTFFWLASNVFSITLHTWLGSPHPLTIGLSQCICD